MEVIIDNRDQDVPNIDPEKICSAVLDELNLAHSAEVSVVFTDDEEIHALNREYRGVDRPTDVLSFCQNEGDEDFDDVNADFAACEEENEILGDIVISVPTARRQAAEAGKTPEEEITLLIIHGTLHLLGYDHAEPEEEREMFALQNEILAKCLN